MGEKLIECYICSHDEEKTVFDSSNKKIITIKKGGFFSKEVIEVRICEWCGEGLEKLGFDNTSVHLIIKEKDLINNKDAVIKHRDWLDKELDREMKKYEKEDAREEKAAEKRKKELLEKYGEKDGLRIFENKISEEKYLEEKRIKDTKKKIVNLLKKQKSKMPTSDIDAFLKHQDVDEIKKLCEEMYHGGKISRTANYRYFILSDEKKKPPKKTAAKKPKPRKTSAPKTDSVADEIKKFADLKDQGILTQEEFDAKKKELLGL